MEHSQVIQVSIRQGSLTGFGQRGMYVYIESKLNGRDISQLILQSKDDLMEFQLFFTNRAVEDLGQFLVAYDQLSIV